MIISIVIVTKDRADDLKKLLLSLLKQQFSSFEIIILDNCSKDSTEEVVNNILKEKEVPYTYLKSSKNLGPAGGRNTSFKICKGEYILFLDDDTYIKNELFLKDLYEFMENNSEIGILQTAIYNCKSESYQKPIFNAEKNNGYYEAFNFIGASHFLRSNIFEKGEEIYLPDLFYRNEETYLSLKIISKGYKVAYYPEIELFHNPSSVRTANEKIDFLNFSNGFLIKLLYYPSKYYFLIYIITILRFIKNFNLKKESILKFWERYKDIMKDINRDELDNDKIEYIIKNFGFFNFINW